MLDAVPRNRRNGDPESQSFETEREAPSEKAPRRVPWNAKLNLT
jgi:hypothetical protein